MKKPCAIDLGTVGEFEMFGITLPGLDVSTTDEHARIKIPCTTATILAIRIMDCWNLSVREQADILDVSSGTIQRYAKGVIPKQHTQRDRIRDILCLHKALLILFPANKEMRLQWITAPNMYFDGKSAAEFMVMNGTTPVREYLEAQLFN